MYILCRTFDGNFIWFVVFFFARRSTNQIHRLGEYLQYRWHFLCSFCQQRTLQAWQVSLSTTEMQACGVKAWIRPSAWESPFAPMRTPIPMKSYNLGTLKRKEYRSASRLRPMMACTTETVISTLHTKVIGWATKTIGNTTHLVTYTGSDGP